MSSIAPVIILDSQGKVKFVVGSSGGTHITTGSAMVRDITI